MQTISDKTTGTIAALLSARSFYQFHLDQASIPSEDIALIKAEVELIDQILDNEVEKNEAIEGLLEICESLEPRAPGVRERLDAAMKEVRAAMEHKPQLLVDTTENNGRYHLDWNHDAFTKISGPRVLGNKHVDVSRVGRDRLP